MSFCPQAMQAPSKAVIAPMNATTVKAWTGTAARAASICING